VPKRGRGKNGGKSRTKFQSGSVDQEKKGKTLETARQGRKERSGDKRHVQSYHPKGGTSKPGKEKGKRKGRKKICLDALLKQDFHCPSNQQKKKKRDSNARAGSGVARSKTKRRGGPASMILLLTGSARP